MSVEVSPEAVSDALDVDRLIGEVLANRYQIETLLGEGAMGAVYKARHIKVGRPFAVKVLHKKLLEDSKVLQRFEREAELAGRLRHPNVVGVVDVGETASGDRYMVMDFAAGHDLALLLNEAPMPYDRVFNLTRQMLEGLYHAHEAGLIHRDFKPENVIVERDDHGTEVPRIVDFGIAILREGGESSTASGRLTTNGLVLGTPHYMAPEQAVADPIDHRIDLFALGIVIYEMLCGKLPFDGTGAEVARANLLLDPPPIVQRVPYLEVDPLLEAFARRLMAKKRDHRPATAKAARELLDLIHSDRERAAKLLGVPLSQSSRQPAITQPVNPQTGAVHEDTGEHTAPPVIVETPASAVSLEAPPARSQRQILTEPATPIDYDEPSPRRRAWWIAAGVSGAAVATMVALKLAGGGGTEEPPPAPARIAMEATPPPVEVKQPDPPPVVEDKQPDPPPVEDKQPEVKQPEVKQPVIRKKPPVIAKQPEVKQPEVKQPEVKPDPPKTGAIDADALNALYHAVGADLKVAAAARGPAAVAEISDKYRVIKIHQAMTSDASKLAMQQTLLQLRAQLAPLKKQP